MWPPCHRGNPPWDRERADSWRGLTKKWSPFLSTEALLLYIFSLLFCSRALWMWVTSHFTASCVWPYEPNSSPTNSSRQKKKKQSWRDHSKSSLYGPLLLSVESIDLIDKYGLEPQDFTLTVHLILRLILKRMSTFCTDTKRHNQLFVLPDLETLVFQLVN